jgi:hypothetical protein
MSCLRSLTLDRCYFLRSLLFVVREAALPSLRFLHVRHNVSLQRRGGEGGRNNGLDVSALDAWLNERPEMDRIVLQLGPAHVVPLQLREEAEEWALRHQPRSNFSLID